MTDDHDRCEWVHVSSGTGSSGLSQTESRQPKNGCVCVHVMPAIPGYKKEIQNPGKYIVFANKKIAHI